MKTCSDLSGKWFLVLYGKKSRSEYLNSIKWSIIKIVIRIMPKGKMLICRNPLSDIFQWDVRNEHLETKIDIGTQVQTKVPTCHWDLYREQKIKLGKIILRKEKVSFEVERKYFFSAHDRWLRTEFSLQSFDINFYKGKRRWLYKDNTVSTRDDPAIKARHNTG